MFPRLFNKTRSNRWLAFLWHTAAFLLLLNFLVIPHELGHLLTGVAFGAAVKAFSIGFGPEIFHFTALGIHWQVACLPLGGYVEFAQQAGPGEVLFSQLAVWKQVIVLLAGVTMNGLYALAVGLWLKPQKNWETITFRVRNKGICCIPFAINAGYGISYGWRPFIWYSACASVEMLAFNLLPIPLLDGGQVANLLLYPYLAAWGLSTTMIIIVSLVLAFGVVLPLLARLLRPLVNFLNYHLS